MDGYLIWLVFLALAIFSFSIIQLQAGRNGRLQKDCRQMQTNVHKLQDKLRERERSIDHLQRGNSQLLKWKDRASDLENELRARSRPRVRISGDGCGTWRIISLHWKTIRLPFSSVHFHPGAFTPFERPSSRMLENARFEVIVVSPWIKRQTWDRIKGPLSKFSRQGGKLRVFMRGCESDYSLGLSDDIRKR